MLKLRRKDAHCTVSMRNSTGSPLFSDFKSDLSRVLRFRPLVKGNEDPGYEGGPVRTCFQAPLALSGISVCERVDTQNMAFNTNILLGWR